MRRPVLPLLFWHLWGCHPTDAQSFSASMSEEHKPSDDLKDGLKLIYRAACTAAKQVDMAKVDKSLEIAFSHASRVANTVGRFVTDEFERVSGMSPPWASAKPTDCKCGCEPEKGSERRECACETQEPVANGNESDANNPAVKDAAADGAAECCAADACKCSATE